jgi:hypothetical protein
MLVGGLRPFNNGQWLGLPGATSLSLPIRSVLAFRTLSENARAYANQLFSVPGAFSFNLWTALPTPTLANVTLWDRLLNSSAQSAIIERLKEDSQAVIIRQVDMVFNGELANYIERDFESAFSVYGYEFLVRRGRRVAPLSIAGIRPDPANSDYSLLNITLRELSGPITSIEIWQIGQSSRLLPEWIEDVSPATPELESRSLLARLDQEIGSLRLTPLNEDGTPSGGTKSSSWPVQTQNAITLLEGRFEARLLQRGDLFVVIRSADRSISLAPVRP